MKSLTIRGDIVSQWKKVKLSELGEIIGGATPSTKREDYYNGGIPWITPKDLAGYNGRYIARGERNISEEGLNSCSAKLMPKYSILFTSRAPIGYIAIAENEICTNQGFKSIVPNEYTDYQFLYYLLKYNKEKIEAMGSGTTFKEVSGTVMKNFEVEVPEIEEQRAIAKILSSLDDKIEMNNYINKNLEVQAQAIFKNWFVDFEPFQNSEFADSELGRIPQGWQVESFTKYVSIHGGGTPKTQKPEYWNGKIPFFTPKDVSSSYFVFNTEKSITETGLSKCNSKLYNKGTIFVTARGTVGKVSLAGRNMAMNQSCYALESEQYGQYFAHQLTIFMLERLSPKASGAVFDALVTRDFDAELVLFPPIPLAHEYNRIVSPIYTQILSNIEQNQILLTIRDTLLPKLMGGEIPVPLEV